ncbi:10823_t:CDS:2 [Ambispora leptoticha]|uniref:10823_t:CDS:1 n=1 Tax=Ambispora leptoticha TaxID=144679 RepID=A0A9N9FSQ5_9GLOM|nr:10823_t:CDS:2 [Ambispora leptoticha]
MDKTQIIIFAKNVLDAIPGTLNNSVQVPKLDPCQLCGQAFIPHPASGIKEFTLASCGHIYHQNETGTQDLMEISPQLSTIAGQKDLPSFMTGGERYPQLFESDPLQSDANNKAQEIDTARTIDENASPLKPTTEICSKCSESISPKLLKPVILLTCKHVIHFECIGNKRNLCPKCPSADDLEKEGYYISPGISLNESPKKKRKKEEDNVHENKLKKISKTQVMIRELSVIPISDEPSITAPSEDSNIEDISNKFYRLYYELYQNGSLSY